MTDGHFTGRTLIDLRGALAVLPSLSLSPESAKTATAVGVGAEPNTANCAKSACSGALPTAGISGDFPTFADNRPEKTDTTKIVASDVSGTSSVPLSLADKMRALGLEPRTHGLKGNGPPAQVNADAVLPNALTSACTAALPANVNDTDRNRDETTSEVTSTAAFIASIAMLDRLPLTDAERAEAVRRLLREP